MKNKKTILVGIVLLIVVLLTSCGGSNDREQCLNSVKEMFPKAKVYTRYEGSNTMFFVIDSVNVYLVHTLSFNSPKVTEVIILQEK